MRYQTRNVKGNARIRRTIIQRDGTKRFIDPNANGKKEFLFKTHAENHGNDPHKAEKIVVQTTVAGSHVYLKVKGKVIAKSHAGYYSVNNKQWIYRFPMWGIDVAKRVRTIKNNPLVNIWVDKQKFGKVNPAYRSGYFRF